MEYGVEVLEADKYVIIYSDTAPGLVCYDDTERRMIQQLTDEGKIGQDDWVGIPDASGDPTDNDAVVQQVLDFIEGSSNPWVYFGIKPDCNEILSALAANGYPGELLHQDHAVMTSSFKPCICRRSLWKQPGNYRQA